MNFKSDTFRQFPFKPEVKWKKRLKLPKILKKNASKLGKSIFCCCWKKRRSLIVKITSNHHHHHPQLCQNGRLSITKSCKVKFRNAQLKRRSLEQKYTKKVGRLVRQFSAQFCFIFHSILRINLSRKKKEELKKWIKWENIIKKKMKKKRKMS